MPMRPTLPRPLAPLSAVLLALALTPTALAADGISVNKANTKYSETERKVIRDWVAERAKDLAEGKTAKMDVARDLILAEFRGAGVTPEYKNELSVAIVQAFAALYKSDNIAVRAEAAHITGALYTPQAVQPLLDLLDDSTEGVRLASAVALNILVGLDASGKYRLGTLDAELETKLLTQLGAHAAQDSQPIVAAQLTRILASINSAKAIETTLDAMEKRLTLHAGNSQLNYAPITDGLIAAYGPLVQRNDRGPAMKRLMRLCVRTYLVCSPQLVGLEKPAADKTALNDDGQRKDIALRVTIAGHQNALRWCDKILRDQFPLLAPPGNGAPPDIKEALTFSQYEKIQATADGWRSILMKPPFDVPEVELTVSGK